MILLLTNYNHHVTTIAIMQVYMALTIMTRQTTERSRKQLWPHRLNNLAIAAMYRESPSDKAGLEPRTITVDSGTACKSKDGCLDLALPLSIDYATGD